MIYKTLYFFLFISFIYSKTDVVVLSQNVGTIIDVHENRFYRIFPNEKGFKNAQFIQLSKTVYKVSFTKIIDKKTVIDSLILNKIEFEKLQNKVNSKPIFTKKDRTAMYKGMDFLKAEEIILDIKKPQYVVLNYSRGKTLKGTLKRVFENKLYVQTPTSIEFVNLENLDKIQYRITTDKYNFLRSYIYTFTGLSGLGVANVYNNQRPTVLNDYGIPRKDLVRYRQLFGIVIGLIFSSEVFDAVATLLTPTESVILSEAEFDRKNINK